MNQQKKITSSQKKTVVCLIQAVVLLSKKLVTVEDRWSSLQRELVLLKVRCLSHRSY